MVVFDRRGVSFSRYRQERYAVRAVVDGEVREARHEGARGSTYARLEEREGETERER